MLGMEMRGDIGSRFIISGTEGRGEVSDRGGASPIFQSGVILQWHLRGETSPFQILASWNPSYPAPANAFAVSR